MHVESLVGFTISKPDQKPVLTGFDENRENKKTLSVFNTKFKFQIWGGGTENRVIFLIYQSVFPFCRLVLFRIQILNEKR
jgi:hypothetical protein